MCVECAVLCCAGVLCVCMCRFVRVGCVVVLCCFVTLRCVCVCVRFLRCVCLPCVCCYSHHRPETGPFIQYAKNAGLHTLPQQRYAFFLMLTEEDNLGTTRSGALEVLC